MATAVQATPIALRARSFTLAGIRHAARARPAKRKAAIVASDLVKIVAAVRGVGSKSVRDRAVLALGLTSALRRSELVAPRLADVELVKQGARLTDWLAVRGQAPGPLFTCFTAREAMTGLPMSDRAIARLVQKYAALAGLDPDTIGAHSLLAVFLTEVARSGASLPNIQEVSRQKKLECFWALSARLSCSRIMRGKGSCKC